MTLKDMMVKVETYNEIASVMGTDKIKMVFDNNYIHESFTTWTDLRKWIRSEYIKPVADALLKFSEYDINDTATVDWEDNSGITHLVSVETCFYTK